jgi:hypothetical protein
VRIRALLLVMFAVAAVVVVAGAVVDDSGLVSQGAVASLVALVGYAVVAGRTAPPLVRWALVGALAVLTVAVARRPTASTGSTVTAHAWFGVTSGRPRVTGLAGLAQVVWDDLSGAAAPLLGYACLVVAVAALPRYHRPRLAIAGLAVVVLALAYAGLLVWDAVADRRAGGLPGLSPPQLLACAATPLLLTSLALAGAAIAAQRVPPDRARGVPASLAAGGMLVLALPGLATLEPAISSAPFRFEQPGQANGSALLTPGLRYGHEVVSTAVTRQVSFTSIVVGAALLAALAVVVWGCLRAARPVPG